VRVCASRGRGEGEEEGGRGCVCACDGTCWHLFLSSRLLSSASSSALSVGGASGESGGKSAAFTASSRVTGAGLPSVVERLQGEAEQLRRFMKLVMNSCVCTGTQSKYEPPAVTVR
jgi:hypothetical protein